MPTALELLPHQRAIIRARGTVEPFEHRATMNDMNAAIGKLTLADTVNLRDGRVMLCDTQSHAKGLPVNELATRLYWSVCRPGTTHQIRGDVLVCPDADFADDDDYTD